MRTIRRLVTLAVAAGLVSISVSPAAGGSADPPLPGLLLEDFSYPDAERILAERGIRLVSGDGHFLLVDCAGGTADLVRVQSRDVGEVCFDILGATGYVAMAVPDVYLIRTDEHAIQATLTSNGQSQVVDLRPNEWNPVGEGSDPDRPAVLLSLNARPVNGNIPRLPVDAEHPFVGRLEFGPPGVGGGWSRGCTATLVSPWWVVSAASCFAPDPDRPVLDPGPPLRPTTVSFGGHDPVPVSHVVPRSDRDVVLARLSAAVRDITPARLANAVAAPGTELVTVGYARGATVWRADTQRKTSVTVTTVSDVALLGRTGPAGLCPGHAGGPAFTGGRLVAVHSRAGRSGCLGSATTGTEFQATRIDNIATWMADNTRVWDGFTNGREMWRDAMWFANAKQVSGDWNGDGRDDLAILYKWNATHAVIHTWTSSGAGLQFTYAMWNSNPNGFWWDNAKFVAGDWNGDGRDDLAVLYKWSDTHTVIHTWTSTGTSLQQNYVVWNSGPNGFWWDNAKVAAGDWNGDGRDDLAVLYKWSATHTVIHTWTLNGASLQQSYVVWNSGAGGYEWDRATLAAGDWNGDGRHDLAALYRTDDTRGVIQTWTGTGTGLRYNGAVWDSGPDGFPWADLRLVAGDWNGDRRTDLAVHYRVSDTHSEIRAWTSTGTGFSYLNPAVWESDRDSPVRTVWEKAVPVAADLTAAGRDGLAAFFDNGGDNASIVAFDSFSTGSTVD